MPLWLLSGAFFPVPAVGAGSAWEQVALHWVMRMNPVTYSVAGARHLLYSQPLPEAFWTPSPVACWGVTFAFAVLMFAAATWISGQRTKGDLL
jgi:ABC-2 type transport system permease protein